MFWIILTPLIAIPVFIIEWKISRIYTFCNHYTVSVIMPNVPVLLYPRDSIILLLKNKMTVQHFVTCTCFVDFEFTNV